MALVSLPTPMIWMPAGGMLLSGLGSGVGSSTTMPFNAAGDKAAIIFKAETTTVPDLISFVVNAVTTAGTAGAIEATLENVTTGDPSGAVTNSATGSGTISTTGIKTISGMAGTATITAGNIYAIVLTAGSGWDRNLTIRTAYGTAASQSFPFIKTKDSAGAWTAVEQGNSGYPFGVADSGGTYFKLAGFMGAHDCVVQAYSSSTNPDERGNRFVLPAPMRLAGWYSTHLGGPGANDDVEYKLLTSHTGTPTEVVTVVHEGENQGSRMPHIIMIPEADRVNLSAGTTYAITMEALGTETQSLARWAYASSAALAGALGTSFYSTTRNDGGSCTDDSTYMYGLFPIFDQIDDGTGGGSASGVRNPLRGPIL